MKIIGLTGGIACGKSQTTKYLKSLNIPVIDCDAINQEKQLNNKIVFQQIQKEFPEVIEQGKVNRKKLSHLAFSDVKKLKKIEQIMMPHIYWEIAKQLHQYRKENQPIVVIDAPLLFETGLDKICHQTLCIWVTPEIQRQRVLDRPGMNEEKLQLVLNSQLSTAAKKNCADIAILGDTLPHLHQQINMCLETVKKIKINSQKTLEKIIWERWKKLNKNTAREFDQ